MYTKAVLVVFLAFLAIEKAAASDVAKTTTELLTSVCIGANRSYDRFKSNLTRLDVTTLDSSDEPALGRGFKRFLYRDEQFRVSFQEAGELPASCGVLSLGVENGPAFDEYIKNHFGLTLKTTELIDRMVKKTYSSADHESGGPGVYEINYYLLGTGSHVANVRISWNSD